MSRLWLWLEDLSPTVLAAQTYIFPVKNDAWKLKKQTDAISCCWKDIFFNSFVWFLHVWLKDSLILGVKGQTHQPYLANTPTTRLNAETKDEVVYFKRR